MSPRVGRQNMIDYHCLAMPGKGGRGGIDCPTQRGHTNPRQRLLDRPIVGWLHVSKSIQLDVQMMFVEVFAQIPGQRAFAAAARTVEDDDGPMSELRISVVRIGVPIDVVRMQDTIVDDANRDVEPSRLTNSGSSSSPATGQTTNFAPVHEATGKLGQPKQQLHTRLMTTLLPRAVAGHTPMMHQYLRRI
jgi:hypothetical protein